MFKRLLLPTDCKLCYWGRLALAASTGCVFGVEWQSYWAVAPFAVVVGIMGALKWLIVQYPE